MRNITKIWVWFRWFLLTVPLGIFAFFTAWIMFPIAWCFDILGKWNPLWIYLDDTRYDTNSEGYVRGFSEDYELWLMDNGGIEESFLQEYRWCVGRNRVWNLIELIKPLSGYTDIADMVVDELVHRGEHLPVTETSYPYMAALKFRSSYGTEGWNVNQGEYISTLYSIFGTSFFYYKTLNRSYFRYSSVKMRKILFWRYWVTIKLGTNPYRYVFSVKINKPKKIW